MENLKKYYSENKAYINLCRCDGNWHNSYCAYYAAKIAPYNVRDNKFSWEKSLKKRMRYGKVFLSPAECKNLIQTYKEV